MPYHGDIYVGVDVDGTIYEFEFPELGPPVPLAFLYLKKLNSLGVKLILHTMRCQDFPEGRDTAQEAVDDLEAHGVEIWAVNDNPDQHSWTGSNKVYCHYYVDDSAIGTPLVKPEGRRAYVDWGKVGPLLIDEVKKRLDRYKKEIR